jgi:hypothetical protein
MAIEKIGLIVPPLVVGGSFIAADVSIRRDGERQTTIPDILQRVFPFTVSFEADKSN